MRWNSVIRSTSEGDRSAEITVHMTEGEAALIALALEEFKVNAAQGLIEHRPDLEFGPAQYVAVEFLVDWIERACCMTREQLYRVNWWETLEELDAEDWAEFAPRCELPSIQVSELGSVPELPPLLEAELDAIMRELDPAGVFA